MHGNDSKASRAAPLRGFMALFAILVMGLGLMDPSAEAAPFAYVSNSNSVSVIDTATHPPSVLATIPVGSSSGGVAVAPNGKHVYVANFEGSLVWVIDAATNMVVAIVPVGNAPLGVAVNPDGKHAYVTNSGGVSVIDTATNMVAATVSLGATGVAVAPDGKHAYTSFDSVQTICFMFCETFTTSSVAVVDTATNMVAATVNGMTYAGVVSIPINVAVTPDGKHVYAANLFSNSVSVIDTGSNAVVGTPIPTGISPGPVAITPDGKDAYVTNAAGSNVSVIDTATNTVVAQVPVGTSPQGVAITPDGKDAYVANGGSNTVSVIDTASKAVVATVPVGNGPLAVGIIPDVPFLVFGANLVIAFGGVPNQDSFALQTSFTSSSTAPAINPLTEPVTLQAGTFAITIPPGSFVETKQGFFVFAGVINGVALEAAIEQTGTLRYAFQTKAAHASLTGTTNPVTVRLSIGDDSGITSVTAKIFH